LEQDQTLLALQKLELDEDTRSHRSPWKWTEKQKKRRDHILTIMNGLRQWWPLSVRQIYYQLISSDLKNDPCWSRNYKGEYGPVKDLAKHVGTTLKWMRIDEIIPWDSITDEHRTITAKVGFHDPEEFIDWQRRRFLTGYSRCLAQKQEYHVEVWIEKAALLHIVEPVADEFCRRVVVCKGYNSITFQTGFYVRATEAMRIGQTPLVLYFGDWDPSGENMFYTAIQTLEEELDLYGVEYWRGGINPEHFKHIPAAPVPIKLTDSRLKRFVDRHGPTAYELDAFHPLQLEQLVRESIAHFTDMAEFKRNEEQGEIDKDEISRLRGDMEDYLRVLLDETNV
jgi:hypothetical protein